MSKYCGKVGYVETYESSPGVWEEHVTERTYYGDVTKNSRRLENTTNVNSDIQINNIISIVADDYAYEHILNMRYVTWMGVKWMASSVDVARPRLNITLGGVYHEEQT